jgi:hypothetical protein
MTATTGPLLDLHSTATEVLRLTLDNLAKPLHIGVLLGLLLLIRTSGPGAQWTYIIGACVLEHQIRLCQGLVAGHEPLPVIRSELCHGTTKSGEGHQVPAH